MSDDIAVAVITVDPERDTPDRLAAYATHWPVQWRFLTEAHAVISRVWKAYGIVVAKQETNARDALTGARGYDVIHSARAVVLNRDGFTAADLRGDWEAPALQRALESVLANRPVEGGNVRSRLISDIFSRCGEWASKHPWAFSALLLLAMLPGLAIPAYVLRILLRPGRAPEDARR